MRGLEEAIIELAMATHKHTEGEIEREVWLGEMRECSNTVSL